MNQACLVVARQLFLVAVAICYRKPWRATFVIALAHPYRDLVTHSRGWWRLICPHPYCSCLNGLWHAPPVTPVPRPWLPREIPFACVRDASAGEAHPPLSHVEVRPHAPPAEARPPTMPLEVCPPDVEVPAVADTEASVSPNWGEQVGQEEASGGLAPDVEVPVWARPTLSYAHVLDMVRPRWLQGESASGHVARFRYVKTGDLDGNVTRKAKQHGKPPAHTDKRLQRFGRTSHASACLDHQATGGAT